MVESATGKPCHRDEAGPVDEVEDAVDDTDDE